MTHEAQIESSFIGYLSERSNQWTYRPDIKTEAALWENLRGHINRINVALLKGVPLTDKEFEQVRNEFQRHTHMPFLASVWLRGENGEAKIDIEREDASLGKPSLLLFSNKDIAGGISSYEVVNQIMPSMDGTYKGARGDVTLLINGLPVIHIELKSESAKDGYRQAFDQIERYAGAGFFNGIYATVQIFVISNKVSTKYFARPSTNHDFSGAKKFLFNWREADNTPVEDLYDFARKVLKIPSAHELISRYTILVDDKKGQKFMMVLRPYQIHAIEKIRNQVAQHEGGFIWHATGSGKTITSFVATKLLAQSASGVGRTVMIVDRKDLDSQTKNEFSKFASEYNTGLSSGDAAANNLANTLIVGIDNKRELVDNFLNRKNSNTIIITTIQKLSRALREAREAKEELGKGEASDKTESIAKRFEKLKGEHIVFIVDECHRAVSDKEMREIKKFFPRSTWFGFTGTPIFEENKKTEMGDYARTTSDQYGVAKDGTPLPNGGLLHAYTTKNAMDDKSVLDFQVEYHTLLKPEDEPRFFLSKIADKFPNADPETKLKSMSDVDKEALYEIKDAEGKTIFESDDYITKMLTKIFRHQSVLEKFKVVNGMPTMSGILTTNSIAQAKRIYRKLMELKKSGDLITGDPLTESRRLNDPDFPRVAITYSLSEKQVEQNKAGEELLEIMREYDATFGTHYAESAKKVKKAGQSADETEIDDSNYNTNINNRLARKGAQYQLNGQWLDLVIVVDRLLTGFDAPTIQALYVDKELRWHGLLQAFSRTNRVMKGKDIGMIVTFRKPWTMRENVKDAFKLFSQEKRDWERLVPREYKAVRQELTSAHEAFKDAQRELEQDLNDLKKRLNAIKTFQTMKHLGEAIKSYEDFEEDYGALSDITDTIKEQSGHIENEKAAVKEILAEQGVGEEEMAEALEIEFSSDQKETYKEKVDSYYISQLLKDIGDENSRQKFNDAIKDKPAIVKTAYDEALGELDDEQEIVESVDNHFRRTIDEIIMEAAAQLEVPEDDLQISFAEYSRDKSEVPYINVIIGKSALTKDEFERAFPGEKFRRKIVVIGEYWRKVMDERLLPLKEELVNFSSELRHLFAKSAVKKHKAIAVRLDVALDFIEGHKTTEFRTFKCQPGTLLLCSSSTSATKGFAFMLVDVVRCDGVQGDYEWILDNFRPIVPFPVKNGQKFFYVEAELKWLDEVYPDGLPDDFWKNTIYK